MTVRIEAGKIGDCGNGEEFRRFITVTDDCVFGPVLSRIIYAKTKEELEVIDHENFMKE
jgi:hypothetical protein